ncbi:two-component response regulator ARR11-like [Lotus japonicus]|uniref:two-component response regulator ARR11-like n=1 Tax=Lotus japonicus TaxID=34305 RepID=UPI0025894DF2|nr:two-component response regulator ARR11-like [Lotus japonicus]
MENGRFPCPLQHDFPAGLRVLLVDHDPTCLQILERKLKKCDYEVTACCLARHALNLLRERKDGYDIVISDENISDMDWLKLLEHVRLEMDLPFIMMSKDGETSKVMKSVQLGACAYLHKPVRIKELKIIWQHVLRKRIDEAREFESFESIHLMKNGSEQSDYGDLIAGEGMTSTKKRKVADNREFSDPSTTKKARFVWSDDLHYKFAKAVNQIGLDKAGPKKILDLMNVPWLTREKIASHLQKYRLYLSRLQKDGGQKSSSKGNLTSFDCAIPTQYSWTEVPGMQLREEQKSIVQLEDSFNQLPPLLGKQHHIQVDQSQSIASISSTPAITEAGIPACIETKSLFSDYQSSHTSSVSSEVSALDTFPIQPGSLMMSDQPLQPTPAANLGLKTQGSNLSSISDLEFYQRNLLLGGDTPASLDEDLYSYWIQGGCYNMNFGLQSTAMTEFYDPGFITEVLPLLYDSTDYSGIDQIYS